MIGERLSDRYEILSELGRGGMGVVYRARDPFLVREVAVKVISLARISEEAEERFRREAQLVGQMDHPGIVPIYDLGAHQDGLHQDGLHQDMLFFVMPVVEGTTLQTLIRGRRLTCNQAIEIVAQVAEALDYSHSRGVIHRDIKPENVMVTWNEGQPRARVMDFGLALVGASSRLTRTGKLPGTLIYLSPEQILAADIDPRSDLFSLGTILYECLSGSPPFSGSRYSLLYRIAHEPPPSLDAFVDPTLSTIILSCLAKDPEDRPARGQVLAEALRRYQSNSAAPSDAAATLAAERAEASGITPIAGRLRETTELRQMLEQAYQGSCRLVTIGAEAGMGKTRLLQYVEELARQRPGTVVLKGRFSTEDAFPYQGFGELIEDFFRQRETTSGGAGESIDLSDLGADLLALFPMLRGISLVREAARATTGLAMSVEEASADRTRIFELVARTLTRLADGRALVLLLEQLHASAAAIEALQYLFRRLGPTATLIVGTYRPSEHGRRHPLVRMLRGIKGDRRTSSLIMGPLSEDEHRQMLETLLTGSAVQDGLVEQLFGTTEGNPFFVQEWVRWLLETGEISRDEQGVWSLSGDAAMAQEALPETIQQAIESRLEQLPDDKLQVLRMASILGRSFDFVDLEALVEGDSEERIDELINDGLIEEESRGREEQLVFSSRLVRKTLYHGLPRRRRRTLHRRHAEHLEARYAGRRHRVYSRLVHHFAEGDVAERTVYYALELSRQAIEGFAWEAAIRATRTALEFIEDDAPSARTEGELRRLLASALRFEGQLGPALKEANRAVRTSLRADSLADAAEGAVLAARIAWQGRKAEETRSWVSQGIDLARGALAESAKSERGQTDKTKAGDSLRESLRQLLIQDAMLANLGGEYARAQILRQEAEELRPNRQREEAPRSQGGTLVISLANGLRQKIISRSTTVEEIEILSNIYETLLKSDAAGNLIPTLCREWEGSARGQRFRFTLRDHVRFSDGSPLRAADVKNSFEHAARVSEVPAPAIRALLGFDEFVSGEAADLSGVLALSDGVVEFQLRKPLPIFPSLLTDPRTAITRLGNLGTGPFRWPEDAPGKKDGAKKDRLPAKDEEDSSVLERNPNDWRRRPASLDGLHFKALPHAFDAARGLRSQQIDLARDLRAEDAEEILRDPRFRAGLVEATQRNVFYVLFNANGPLGHHLELRQALANSVHVQDLVWKTLGRLAQPATGLIPPGILGHDPGRREQVMTADEARGVLASAGLSPPIRLQGAAHPRLLDRYAALIAEVLETWEAFGVRVKLQRLAANSYLSRAADPEGLDLCFGRWDFAYDDPDNLAYEMLHSRFGRVAPYLVSDAADSLLERARQEVRATHRQRLYRRIEGLLARQSQLLPLFYDVRHGVRGARVSRLKLQGSPPFVNYAEVVKADEQSSATSFASRGARLSGTLHIPLPTAVPGLAPDLAVMVEASEMIPTVFETLTTIEEEGAHVVPHLATDFRLEEGGLRYRFRLRPNVRFHDGRRLSVRDVRYSFERLLKHGRKGSEASLMPIRGARALRRGQASELAGFRVISERDFSLDLEAPLSFFPAMLTSPITAIVPEGATIFDGNWRHGTAGTGPFRVVRFVADDRLELEAYPHYWRTGLPRCDRLIFEFGLSSQRIAADFRDGKLALASHLRPADLEQLRRDPALAAGYREAPGFSTYYLAFNCHRGPLADPELRRTLVANFDKLGAAAMLGRAAATAVSIIPPGLPGHDAAHRPLVTPFTSSTPPELAGLRLRCSLHPAFSDTYQDYWRWLVQSLAAGGVELEVQPRQSGEILTAATAVDIVASRWVADYPDSDTFAQLLHSADGIDGHLVGSPGLDLLIEQGRNEVDPANRQILYQQIERRIRDEILALPLFHESVYRFTRPEVHGLRLGVRSPVVAYEKLSLAS